MGARDAGRRYPPQCPLAPEMPGWAPVGLRSARLGSGWGPVRHRSVNCLTCMVKILQMPQLLKRCIPSCPASVGRACMCRPLGQPTVAGGGSEQGSCLFRNGGVARSCLFRNGGVARVSGGGGQLKTPITCSAPSQPRTGSSCVGLGALLGLGGATAHARAALGQTDRGGGSECHM